MKEINIILKMKYLIVENLMKELIQIPEELVLMKKLEIKLLVLEEDQLIILIILL